MKANLVPSGNFLAVDFVEQRGESINDTFHHTAVRCRSVDYCTHALITANSR